MAHNHFALHLSTLRGQHDVRHLTHKMKAAATAGFTGVAITMEDVECWVRSGKRLQQLLQFARDNGMEITELGNINMCDSRGRISDCAREFATAAALEVPLVSAVYNKDTSSLDQARSDWASFCGTVSDMEDMTVGLHFVGTAKHFNTLDHAYDITNDGPANGKIVMDIFEFWRGGSPAVSLEMVPMETVAMVHVADMATIKRFQAAETDRAYPGTGVMPLTHIISTLSRRGYEGMFSVEVHPERQQESCANSASQAYRATRKLLGTSGPSHRKLLTYTDYRTE